MKAIAFPLLATTVFSSDDIFDLKLIVEVTRHGQRAPEKIFDLALNPDENFKVPHNLTKVGAKSHHATGRTLR